MQPGRYRLCDVGASASIYHDGGDVDWTESTFHGNALVVPAGNFTCKNATFKGYADVQFGGAPGCTVDFTGPTFTSGCRFDSLSSPRVIQFDTCTFSVAPVLTNVEKLPQQY